MNNLMPKPCRIATARCCEHANPRTVALLPVGVLGSAVRRVNSHYAAQWELVRTEAGIIFWITGELFAALLMLRRRGAVADNGVVICDG